MEFLMKVFKCVMLSTFVSMCINAKLNELTENSSLYEIMNVISPDVTVCISKDIFEIKEKKLRGEPINNKMEARFEKAEQEFQRGNCNSLIKLTMPTMSANEHMYCALDENEQNPLCQQLSAQIGVILDIEKQRELQMQTGGIVLAAEAPAKLYANAAIAYKAHLLKSATPESIAAARYRAAELGSLLDKVSDERNKNSFAAKILGAWAHRTQLIGSFTVAHALYASLGAAAVAGVAGICFVGKKIYERYKNNRQKKTIK